MSEEQPTEQAAAEAGDQPASVLAWLLVRYPGEKRQNLQRFIRERRVLINGVPADHLKVPLTPDDHVQLRAAKNAPPRELRRTEDESLPVGQWVVYEDQDLLVINKPAGVITSSGPNDKRPTLWRAVKAGMRRREPQSRMGLIHRLDADATGLLVFSKNDAAYQSLKAQFFRHTVERVYRAVVTKAPRPTEGRRISRLAERADGTVYSTTKPGKGELAVTDYRMIRHGERRAMVEVKLHTGRKHQIRVHLSEMGTPIMGDRMYGKGEEGETLLLQAAHLTLEHPRTGKRVHFEAPPTPAIHEALQAMQLRRDIPNWEEIERVAPKVNWPGHMRVDGPAEEE